MGGENVNKVLGELKLAIRSGGRRNRGFYDALLSRDGDALAEGFWGDHWKEIKIKKKGEYEEITKRKGLTCSLREGCRLCIVW